MNVMASPKYRPKYLVNQALGRFGYRMIRENPDSPYVRWQNFVDLARSYEYQLNASGPTDEPSIRERQSRFRLLSDATGTRPGKAYEIIRMLAATATIGGDVCEFGVAQGSTSALIANEIQDSSKTLHLFDSFEGLSRPTSEDTLMDDIFSLGDMAAYEGSMATPVESVKSKLATVPFPSSRYVIHPGFVQDTLKSSDDLPNRVAFAYLDMDLYEPTAMALEWLDDVTPQGAAIVLDDYDFFSSGVKMAVDEFVGRDTADGVYELRVPDTQLGHFAVIRKNR
jgi:O-methyltransferase